MTTTEPFNWRAHVKVHPAAELLPTLSETELQELADDIAANGMLSFAVADKDGNLLDGRNRLDALALLGVLEPAPGGGIRIKGNGDPIRWRILGDGDPYDQVLSLNIHRRHLTAEQKNEVIAEILKAKPELSNRQIGKLVKADHHKVAKVRRKAESTGEVSPVEKTVGADGKARTKPKTDPKLVAVKAQAKALGLRVRQIGSTYCIGDRNGTQVATTSNLDEATEKLAALRSKTEPPTVTSESVPANTEPDDTAEDPAGLVMALIKNAREKANIAVRNLQHEFSDAERAEIAEAIDGLIRKWESVKRKVRAKEAKPAAAIGNDVDPDASAAKAKAAHAAADTDEDDLTIPPYLRRTGTEAAS